MPRYPAAAAPAATLIVLAANLAAQQFVDERIPTVDPSGTYVAPADLDGDGLVDLLSVEQRTLRWHHNRGRGRFAPPLALPMLNASPAVDAGDVEGDGDLDLVVWEQERLPASAALELRLLRQTAGTFTTTVIHQVASIYPGFVRFVDFDGDGDLDVLAAAPSLALLQNNGAAGFVDVSAQWLPAGLPNTIRDAVALDVDGDGRRDLALPNAGPMVLLRNTGTGFVDQTATRLPGHITTNLVVGDLDGDGDPDLVSSHWNEPVKVLRNQGGTFVAASAGSGTFVPMPLALLDEDGDGDLDIVSHQSATAEVWVLRNDGAGNFAAAPPLAAPRQTQHVAALVVADFEGDGDADLILVGSRISVLLGRQGGGLFEQPVSTELGSLGGALDLDGDHDLDLVVNGGFFVNGRDDRWSYRAAGTGGALPSQARIGDLDGDGDPDFVANGVYRNDGTGQFTLDLGAGYVPQATGAAEVLGDFDGDGDLDIAALHDTPAQLRLYLNDGLGVFTAGPVLAVVTFASGIAAGDIDGDGRLDVAVSGVASLSVVRLFRNVSTTNFAPMVFPSIAGQARIVRLDANGSAHVLVASNGGAGTRAFRLAGGAFVEVTGSLFPAGVSTAALADGDVDGDGDVDLVAMQHLLRNDGAAGLTAEPLDLGAPPSMLLDVDGDRDLDLLLTNGVLWNRERQLTLPLAPHTGLPLRVEVSSRPGRALFDIALLGVALQSRAVGLPGPLGLLFVDAPLVTLPVPIPPGTGLAAIDLPIPAQAGLVGVALHLQTLHWSPAGLGFGNAVVAVIE